MIEKHNYHYSWSWNLDTSDIQPYQYLFFLTHQTELKVDLLMCSLSKCTCFWQYTSVYYHQSFTAFWHCSGILWKNHLQWKVFLILQQKFQLIPVNKEKCIAGAISSIWIRLNLDPDNFKLSLSPQILQLQTWIYVLGEPYYFRQISSL